jgi:2EXR family
VQLKTHAIHDLGPLFSKLPRELRKKIYDFALPNGTWKTEDVDSPKCNFLENIGDLSGFYYPLSSLSILKINKEMRREALPLAYRTTMFRLDDMDELIKLLIAVGRVGRDNIESMEFAWQSRIDLEQQCSRPLNSTEDSLSLPTLHVGKCLQLLRQCKNLKFLRILFDSDLLLDIPPEAYAPETGFRDLCSIRGIKKLELWDLASEPLKQHIFVAKLKEVMQSSRQETEDDAEASKQRGQHQHRIASVASMRCDAMLF